ncbi:MAG TPA: dethiobiotin synthase [Chthoniobacteraceae bacterium]|jgi:dethiobiotin synthetase
MNIFVTGTDTGVGKTYISRLLIEALRRAGHDTVGMKPICCGDRADAEELHAASGHAVPLNLINPVWLRAPAAPYAASLVENRTIDLSLVRDAFAELRSGYQSLIVEGVGGWRVPITRDYFVSDLAAEFALPVVVVVANRLGALNHAILTLEAVRSSGLSCAGLILNETQNRTDESEIATSTNLAVLESVVDAPILFTVSCGQREVSLVNFSDLFSDTAVQKDNTPRA